MLLSMYLKLLNLYIPMNFKPFMLFQTKFQNIDCPKCKYIYLRIDAHFHPKLAPQYILGRTSMSKYLTNLRKGKPENCMQQSCMVWINYLKFFLVYIPLYFSENNQLFIILLREKYTQSLCCGFYVCSVKYASQVRPNLRTKTSQQDIF